MRNELSSDPYREGRARHYKQHHQKNLRTRLTSWREQEVVRLALEAAGRPEIVLDLPCGTGRYWPVFESNGCRKLIAADISEAMLDVAAEDKPNIADFSYRQLDLFDIDLPDNSVEFISCQRFLHHVSIPEERAQVLSELRRVASGHVAISLWVDGNLQGRRYVNREIRPEPGYGRRICRRRNEVEREFLEAGFTIIDHYDVWPGIAMWRLYLLKV